MSCLLLIAGPAGSGKSTLCSQLVDADLGFSRVVTATTRAPRPGEIDGVHYHFLTPEKFDEKVAEDAFFEWAWVHRKHRYGTLRSSIMTPLRMGKSLTMIIDVQGAESFRKAARKDTWLRERLVTVFLSITPEESRKRMVLRGDSPDDVANRLRTLESELAEGPKFDFLVESGTREQDLARVLDLLKNFVYKT